MGVGWFEWVAVWRYWGWVKLGGMMMMMMEMKVRRV